MTAAVEPTFEALTEDEKEVFLSLALDRLDPDSLKAWWAQDGHNQLHEEIKRRRESTYGKVLTGSHPTKITLQHLKDLCRSHGLQISGTKKVLQERLAGAGIDTKQTGLPDSKLRERVDFFFGRQVATDPTHVEDPLHSLDTLWQREKQKPLAVGQSEAMKALRRAQGWPAPSVVEGTLGPTHLPTIAFLHASKPAHLIKWPLSEADEETIFGRASASPDNLEGPRTIAPDKLNLDTEWKKLLSDSTQSDLLERVRKDLAPEFERLEARLAGLRIASPEYPAAWGFPYPEPDENTIGNLIIDISVLRGSSSERLAGDESTPVPVDATASMEGRWVAFGKDDIETLPHSSAGPKYRIHLAYQLVAIGEPIKPDRIDLLVQDAVRGLFEAFDSTAPAANTASPAQDLILGLLLRHNYGIMALQPGVLQGEDAAIYSALTESGRYEVLLLPVQIKVEGILGDGKERVLSGSTHPARLLAESGPTDHVWASTYPVDTHIPPKGFERHHSFALITKHSLQNLGVHFVKAWNISSQEIASLMKPQGPTKRTAVGVLFFHGALLVRAKRPPELIPIIPPPVDGVDHPQPTHPTSA